MATSEYFLVRYTMMNNVQRKLSYGWYGARFIMTADFSLVVDLELCLMLLGLLPRQVQILIGGMVALGVCCVNQ